MRILVLITGLIIILVLAVPVRAHHQPRNPKHMAKHAITFAWCNTLTPCRLGDQAIRIADCETGGSFSPWAGVGKHQYWGLFQVSSHWRTVIPGFAFNVWAQAIHAHKVFLLTKGWTHWECAYLTGVL